MKPLDNRNRHTDAQVDDILEQLKSGGSPLPKAKDSDLDNILAELGVAQSANRGSVWQVPASPAQDRQTQSAPVSKPETAAKQAKDTARLDNTPAQDTAEFPAVNKSAPEPKVAPREDKAVKTAPPAQHAEVSIMDIEVAKDATSAGMPRVGKAAALDKVDATKFTGDTELLSWFSGEAEEQVPDKKEERRLAKERKRQLSLEKKEEKARRKKTKDEGEYVDFGEPEPEPELEERLWADVPEDDVITGSAFDKAPSEENWDEEDILAQEKLRVEMAEVKEPLEQPEQPQPLRKKTGSTTQRFDVKEPAQTEGPRVPTAAYTQEFDSQEPLSEAKEEQGKSLFVDEMVDDRFREFFGETVIVDRTEIERAQKTKDKRRKKRKNSTTVLTGEFAPLAQQMQEQQEEYDQEEDEELDDYNRPQDAPAIEEDILSLRASLTRRVAVTGVLTLLLIWLSLGLGQILPLPQVLNPQQSPLFFSLAYLGLLGGAIAMNFTTVAAGLIGVVGEPTVDTAPALASVATLLQAVVLLVQMMSPTKPAVTLFGSIAALLLMVNALGKRMRAQTILYNFRLTSGGFDHSAAYVLDGGHDVAYHITKGLEESSPSLLVSRPTALVKGFLRQSFSRRWSDEVGRILGWVLLGFSLVISVIVYVKAKDLLSALSALAAVLCIGAPLSSTLLSAIPSTLLQQASAKVGAVIPGWSAIEELGEVNVVMAGARDIFPPSSLRLKGIKTFEKERIDLAILYAASVFIEGCDTLRDIFMAVIEGKSEMLYKVESLVNEPGRGFTAWVNNSRVVLGNREMLQKHDVVPPSVEAEMKYVPEGCRPVYLAVSGKLFAMFVVSYSADPEVQDTLDGLIQSGVSLLITSDDMSVDNQLIEQIYNLPEGVVKVLNQRELNMLEPLTEYLPESEGVMAHIGTFTSFIGGMRAAAGCAAAERMSATVQIASVGLACLLCLLLAFSGGLATLAFSIVLLYQIGWTVLISALPFVRRY